MIARRSLLLGLGSLVASPAVIRVAPIMRIKPVPVAVPAVLYVPSVVQAWFDLDAHMREVSEHIRVYGQVLTGVRGDGTPYVVPFDEWAIA